MYTAFAWKGLAWTEISTLTTIAISPGAYSTEFKHVDFKVHKFIILIHQPSKYVYLG